MKYFIVPALVILLSCCSFVDKKLSYYGIGNCANKYTEGDYLGHNKLGKTYQIKDKSFTPEVDLQYQEEGVASWYGDAFHCKKTANGEVFNKWEYSAAHRTLPLPSVVRVTNLSNNKSIIVTVNDRGPFAKEESRIIDVSENAAHKLGFKHKGVEKVRVEYLHHESNKLLAKLSLPEHIYFKNNKVKVRKKISIEEDENSLNQFMELVAKQGKVSDDRVALGEFSKKEVELLTKKLATLGKVSYREQKKIKSNKKSYQVYLTGFSGDRGQLKKKIKTILRN